MKWTLFESEKQDYLPHSLSDQGRKGSVVIRKLHGGTLEITDTIPLTI